MPQRYVFRYEPMTILQRVRVLAAPALAVCLMATPVFAGSETPGLPNFHQVNDRLSRGAQPSDAGFQQLAKLGVKSIVDLRESGGRSTAEQRLVESLGMRYINVPLNGLAAPTIEQVAKLHAIFDSPAAGDRKSTRLNSSHLGISYAVFCLKKTVVQGPAGLHDLSGNRQRRNQRRGRRVTARVPRGFHRQGILGAAVELFF